MNSEENLLSAAQRGDEEAFKRLIAPYLRELRTFCYQMAGSMHEADDLMQEALLRVWKGLPGFEQRSSLRTWLYKVTSNVCVDNLDLRQRRGLPMDLGSAAGAGDAIGPPRLDLNWLEPCPAELYASSEPTPGAVYERRQSVALAFLIAIQLLPAKQRAVLMLHDVMGFQAAEIAQLMDLTPAAVHSALQRARGTLTARQGEGRTDKPTSQQSTLLKRYMEAWESADVDALVALLLDDATLQMPPLAQWIQGAGAIGAAIGQMVFAPAGPGVFRLTPTEANGQAAFAAYQLNGNGNTLRAMALHVLEIRDDRIAAIVAFLNPATFAVFDLPMEISR